MTAISFVRALGAWLGGRRTAPKADGDTSRARFFLGVGGRPMRVTVTDASADALREATEDGEQPLHKANKTMQLRGVARVDGKLVALHDVDPMPATEGQPEGRQPEGRRPVNS
jgi:hypothetical protein